MKGEIMDFIDEEELTDVEVLEFTLSDEEIDELIGKLEELKKTKKSVSFEVDDSNELLINYDDGEGE